MSAVDNLNIQIFVFATLVVPIIFAIIFFWGVRDGQFRGDTESVKFKPLEKELEDEDNLEDYAPEFSKNFPGEQLIEEKEGDITR